MLAEEIFPAGAATTVIGGITDALADNIAVVLGVLAFVVGLRLVLRLFNRSVKGKV